MNFVEKCILFALFINVVGLYGRVQQLERWLRKWENNDSIPVRVDLSGKMQEYIGKSIVPEFYEDEEDSEIDFLTASEKGCVTVIDCDDKWVLVRVESCKNKKSKKKSYEKLLRIHSIKSITSLVSNTPQAEA